MSMNLHEKTWPQVEAYLKNCKKIILPVGSTEQHGPTGLIGIDWLTAYEISQEVGRRTQTMVAPPLCVGMALHHMNFPGTISFQPTTYILVLTEIIQSLAKHGFEEFVIVNGHGGNIAPITSAMSQILNANQNYKIKLLNWWHLPEVTEYEKVAFGDENGFHATCGEIAVTMFTHPDAHKEIPKTNFKVEKDQRSHWPMSPQQFRENYPDGRMGSNPGLSTPEHGAKIFELAVQSISHKLGF